MSASYSRHDRALYAHAIKHAFSVLTGYALQRGHGWYHLADGELIIITERCLWRDEGPAESLTDC